MRFVTLFLLLCVSAPAVLAQPLPFYGSQVPIAYDNSLLQNDNGYADGLTSPFIATQQQWQQGRVGVANTMDFPLSPIQRSRVLRHQYQIPLQMRNSQFIRESPLVNTMGVTSLPPIYTGVTQSDIAYRQFMNTNANAHPNVVYSHGEDDNGYTQYDTSNAINQRANDDYEVLSYLVDHDTVPHHSNGIITVDSPDFEVEGLGGNYGGGYGLGFGYGGGFGLGFSGGDSGKGQQVVPVPSYNGGKGGAGAGISAGLIQLIPIYSGGGGKGYGGGHGGKKAPPQPPQLPQKGQQAQIYALPIPVQVQQQKSVPVVPVTPQPTVTYVQTTSGGKKGSQGGAGLGFGYGNGLGDYGLF